MRSPLRSTCAVLAALAVPWAAGRRVWAETIALEGFRLEVPADFRRREADEEETRRRLQAEPRTPPTGSWANPEVRIHVRSYPLGEAYLLVVRDQGSPVPADDPEALRAQGAWLEQLVDERGGSADPVRVRHLPNGLLVTEGRARLGRSPSDAMHAFVAFVPRAGFDVTVILYSRGDALADATDTWETLLANAWSGAPPPDEPPWPSPTQLRGFALLVLVLLIAGVSVTVVLLRARRRRQREEEERLLYGEPEEEPPLPGEPPGP